MLHSAKYHRCYPLRHRVLGLIQIDSIGSSDLSVQRDLSGFVSRDRVGVAAPQGDRRAGYGGHPAIRENIVGIIRYRTLRGYRLRSPTSTEAQSIDLVRRHGSHNRIAPDLALLTINQPIGTDYLRHSQHGSIRISDSELGRSVQVNDDVLVRGLSRRSLLHGAAYPIPQRPAACSNSPRRPAAGSS